MCNTAVLFVLCENTTRYPDGGLKGNVISFFHHNARLLLVFTSSPTRVAESVLTSFRTGLQWANIVIQTLTHLPPSVHSERTIMQTSIQMYPKLAHQYNSPLLPFSQCTKKNQKNTLFPLKTNQCHQLCFPCAFLLQPSLWPTAILSNKTQSCPGRW